MIDPMPRKDLHVPPTAGEAAARDEGYREGLEAAAAWHEAEVKLIDAILVHTKMSARRVLWCLMADLHEKSAAALRDMASDK